MCQMSNRCVTYALNNATSPYELWFGRRSNVDNIPTFDTLGYLRRFQPEHKLAPRRGKCIMRDLTMGKVLFREAST